MQDFRKLDVWAKAHNLVLSVHKTTQTFAKEEVFGLTLQLRRITVNVASRIVEGCGRENNLEFAGDLRRAAAHCSEVEYYLLLARDLGYIDAAAETRLSEDVIEIRKMIHGFLRKL